MMKYILNNNTGKTLIWETLVLGGISAPIFSALAKTMLEPINEDLAEINAYRGETVPSVTRDQEAYTKCDLNRLTVIPQGDYMKISYGISMNRFSSKDCEHLHVMGFLDISS